MCDPATIAIMKVATGVISAGASIIGGIQQSNAADAQAISMENQAAAEADAARAQAEKIRKAGKAQRGEANVSLAASGVKLGEGTALELQKEITENVEQDAFATLLSGSRAKRTGEEQASITRASGRAAQTAGYMGAAGTLLSTGAGAYSNWKK